MHELFRNGGIGSYPTALFGLILLAVAARYAVKPDNRWIGLQVALAITTIATGAASFLAGLIMTATAVERQAAGGLSDIGDTAHRAGLIGAIGFGESLSNLAIAFALVALAALATTVGVARTTRARFAS